MPGRNIGLSRQGNREGRFMINDILACIRNGEIIEQYPDDYPYPSCLVLGFSLKQRFLHVVVGSDLNTIWIITAYYPDKNKWENNFKIRKETHV